MAGIYVHIPFCSSVCQYCDFYVTTRRKDEKPFFNALLSEISFYSNKKLQVKTIYFGGGTPSVVEVCELEKVLRKIFDCFDVCENPEITIEVNPKEVSFQKLIAYKELGFNRLSIGIQSFFDSELRFLTRLHNSKDGIFCFEISRKAGFENISLDLIFGLENQTLETWQKNIEKIVELSPEHLSLYGLTFYEGTKFTQKLRRGKISKISEELELKMFLFAHEFLEKNGFTHYEISNFCKPNYKSLHNSNYWNHTSYFGFGPSAHSFNENKRFWNVSDLETYVELVNKQGFGKTEEEKISSKMLVLEKMMLGLRQKEGIKFTKTEALKTVPEGYYTLENGFLKLTAEGFAVHDEICEKLI
ncbi:radical SAM family heme chaperone HemW [bacterium]|nr:radical SAM family heme chaperone HemW [bacterium]